MIESANVPRMGAEAARIDARRREVWKALGVPDCMGAVEENISHCHKKDGGSTDVLRSKFTNVDRAKWIPWTTPDLK